MVANLYAFTAGVGGGGSPDSVPHHGQVTAVPTDAETTVVSYVVPVGYRFKLLGLIVTGSANAEWIVYDNTDEVYRTRTSSAERGKEVLHGSAIGFDTGHTVAVKAVHEETRVQNFYATLLGYDG
jgi:hypothetical protein